MNFLHQFRDSFFDDRRHTGVEEVDFRWRNVHANNLMTTLGETCRSYAADVPETENGNPSWHWSGEGICACGTAQDTQSWAVADQTIRTWFKSRSGKTGGSCSVPATP
jgi:hypothetical protein